MILLFEEYHYLLAYTYSFLDYYLFFFDFNDKNYYLNE